MHIIDGCELVGKNVRKAEDGVDCDIVILLEKAVHEVRPEFVISWLDHGSQDIVEVATGPYIDV